MRLLIDNEIMQNEESHNHMESEMSIVIEALLQTREKLFEATGLNISLAQREQKELLKVYKYPDEHKESNEDMDAKSEKNEGTDARSEENEGADAKSEENVWKGGSDEEIGKEGASNEDNEGADAKSEENIWEGGSDEENVWESGSDEENGKEGTGGSPNLRSFGAGDPQFSGDLGTGIPKSMGP
eukprot:Em0017g671a